MSSKSATVYFHCSFQCVNSNRSWHWAIRPISSYYSFILEYNCKSIVCDDADDFDAHSVTFDGKARTKIWYCGFVVGDCVVITCGNVIYYLTTICTSIVCFFFGLFVADTVALVWGNRSIQNRIFVRRTKFTASDSVFKVTTIRDFTKLWKLTLCHNINTQM